MCVLVEVRLRRGGGGGGDFSDESVIWNYRLKDCDYIWHQN